ncbi:hypothetical protein AGLY_003473 [Aphis glycines]|uniref:Uncharacterized protein n=1 Tax=Aphis glycines TaxID=307491 RepID=A0A6G0U285_APHGL|nr:hypothetical protein AGLY_003473 [Aphis glycines]
MIDAMQTPSVVHHCVKTIRTVDYRLYLQALEIMFPVESNTGNIDFRTTEPNIKAVQLKLTINELHSKPQCTTCIILITFWSSKSASIFKLSPISDRKVNLVDFLGDSWIKEYLGKLHINQLEGLSRKVKDDTYRLSLNCCNMLTLSNLAQVGFNFLVECGERVYLLIIMTQVIACWYLSNNSMVNVNDILYAFILKFWLGLVNIQVGSQPLKLKRHKSDLQSIYNIRDIVYSVINLTNNKNIMLTMMTSEDIRRYQKPADCNIAIYNYFDERLDCISTFYLLSSQYTFENVNNLHDNPRLVESNFKLDLGYHSANDNITL